MSKIDSLKQQYPELGMSVIDILARADNSKTNKYLPLLCKLFSSRWNRVRKRLGKVKIYDIHNPILKRKKRKLKLMVLSLTQQYFIYSIMDVPPIKFILR